MTVQLSDELIWIDECYDLGEAAEPRTHKHVSIYLLSAENNVLIDSGSFYHREALRQGIEEATDGELLDALILSHSDYPHSANVREFAATDDETELVASSGSPEIQGLPDATKCEIGGSMTIAGRQFSFIDPPLADRSHSTWIFDHGTETLFTADGFGRRHRPDRCGRPSLERSDAITTDAIYEFHQSELPWLRYVDPDSLREALDAIFEDYPVSLVAPIHGPPIPDDQIETYLDGLIEAADRIAGEGPLI